MGIIPMVSESEGGAVGSGVSAVVQLDWYPGEDY